ncbi:hypothetical protein Pcinc_033233 [Petrolisthes cinctipes]|uniref:Uncharacterized protein n=1 Tax=Petrolisthes cinctipes TaxID=88211 RepID=A0AAE1ESI2_PETCI|nr:hypothetical protein Pcinc_033233 [Petrolisthes cinctipes]
MEEEERCGVKEVDDGGGGSVVKGRGKTEMEGDKVEESIMMIEWIKVGHGRKYGNGWGRGPCPPCLTSLPFPFTDPTLPALRFFPSSDPTFPSPDPALPAFLYFPSPPASPLIPWPQFPLIPPIPSSTSSLLQLVLYIRGGTGFVQW